MVTWGQRCCQCLWFCCRIKNGELQKSRNNRFGFRYPWRSDSGFRCIRHSRQAWFSKRYRWIIYCCPCSRHYSIPDDQICIACVNHPGYRRRNNRMEPFHRKSDRQQGIDPDCLNMGVWSPCWEPFLQSFCTSFLKAIKRNSSIHLVRFESYIRTGLIIAGAFGAYSLGANNIANVMGVFIPAFNLQPLDLGIFTLSSQQQLFLLGSMAIAAGILTYSNRVMEQVGNNIMQLSSEVCPCGCSCTGSCTFHFFFIRIFFIC